MSSGIPIPDPISTDIQNCLQAQQVLSAAQHDLDQAVAQLEEDIATYFGQAHQPQQPQQPHQPQQPQQPVPPHIQQLLQQQQPQRQQPEQQQPQQQQPEQQQPQQQPQRLQGQSRRSR